MSDVTTADVVVVGLGAFGSAALLHLARRGVRVVGIDRFAPPHTHGSSHGETRITRLAVGEGAAYAPLVRRSHELWRELEAESGATLMLQTGGLIMAPEDSAARHHGRENFVQRSIDVAERFGIHHERLKAQEISARYPQFRLRGDEIGYFEPTGGLLIPEQCVATQLQLARRQGASFRLNEQVMAIDEGGGGVRVVTARGIISAGHVVLAAGPWLASLMPSSLRGLARVYRQTLHWFEPRSPSVFAIGNFPVFIWMHGEREEDYFYGFPTPPGTAGVKVATETYARAVQPDDADRAAKPAEATLMHAEHVADRIPLVSSRLIKSAACLYTVTPDSGFVVDTLPDHDRVTVISACSGHGFKHSTGLGEAVAQHLTAGRSTIDLSPFALRRFPEATEPPAAAP